jgi:hypothetical protein
MDAKEKALGEDEYEHLDVGMRGNGVVGAGSARSLWDLPGVVPDFQPAGRIGSPPAHRGTRSSECPDQHCAGDPELDRHCNN